MDKVRRRKRDKKKNFEQYDQTKPLQLVLFELDPKDRDYSQTVELYDFIPKYNWGKPKSLFILTS